jgi:serine/threonine protein kinase/Tol biopolymer transport system component
MVGQGEIIQERYRIIRLLGSGGFGAVYLARDERLGRAVAIKEIDVARLGPDERATAETMFEREAQMLASLDHVGLTRVWDYFQHGRRAFLVMEYVPGETLRDLLVKRGGALPEDFVLACALQLCSVLAYLHSRRPQVIFRDLKPGNVMVVEPPADSLAGAAPEEPVVKLIDFGIARVFKPEQSGDTLIIGTPGYAPPEQYGQGQTDERSDIYSLGATLHHLLSGRAPSGVPLPPLSSVAPTVSLELARVVARATELDPADRYPNVDAMRRDLLAAAQARQLASRGAGWADTGDQHASRPPISPNPKIATPLPLAPARSPAPPRQPSSIPLVLLIVVVLGVVALGALALGRSDSQTGAGQPPRPTPVARPTAPPPAVEWSLPGAPGRMLFGQFNGPPAYDILIATLDGQPPRPITNEKIDFSPAWSPDGQRIAFARIVVKDQRSALLVGRAGAGNLTQIVPPDAYVRYPAFAPDGSQLAFATAPSRQGNFQLATVDLATGAIRLRGPDRVAWITWSPQGLTYAARVAPDQPQDIFVLGASDTPRNLTNTPDMEEDFPAWSPDGRRLAFVASPPANLGQRQIYTIDADGGSRTQLTSGPGPHTNPVWSPDGKWIAYLAQEGSSDWQVWAMRTDGSEPRQITFGPEQKFYLAWGP